jgi:hypothetical protein
MTKNAPPGARSRRSLERLSIPKRRREAGRSDVLPEFYHQMYERMLNQYAELLGRADRVPILEPNPAPSNAQKQTAVVPLDGATV